MMHIDLLEEIYRLWGGKRGYTRHWIRAETPRELSLKNELLHHWSVDTKGYISNHQFEAEFKEYILAL